MTEKTLMINGRTVIFEDERNLLEVIRKAGIDLPTFCYHSDLSIYGACRLCLVEIEGRGIVASCSTLPEAGMNIQTDTGEIREMRKITLELLLANHNRECPTCVRNNNCTLQQLAGRLDVETVRFKSREKMEPIDNRSWSIVRDPNKCVLCGDCVRMCHEVQGIGAIDFAYRGSQAHVGPAFNRSLAEVECVNCGQCAAVCPTGALTPRQETEPVWQDLHDKTKTVVAQIAPAVRVALGELFGMKPGKNVTGKIVAALRMMGFDQVYDTCFTADMTIMEEAHEFLQRFQKGENLPLMTSCCPAWVKFVEIYYPDMIPHLSTCKSPQQMFGSVARAMLPEHLGVKSEDLVVVSIMPCTAKKTEAKLEKFVTNGRPDVDHVLTTQGIGRMIQSMGINFSSLEPESLDMPLGFHTGAGIIFGATGGVMEAALRFAVEQVQGHRLQNPNFMDVRGHEGIREAVYNIEGKEIRVAVVHGLGNARILLDQVRSGKKQYHFIEVMSCPGGCIAGGGQPIPPNGRKVKRARTRALYNADRALHLHKSQENYFVTDCYEKYLGGQPGSVQAHQVLHTHYESRTNVFNVHHCQGCHS